MEKFLVTTAKDTTWPKNNENILFLGEWCSCILKKDLGEFRLFSFRLSLG